MISDGVARYSAGGLDGWTAWIRINGRLWHIGDFLSKEEAQRAYDKTHSETLAPRPRKGE